MNVLTFAMRVLLIRHVIVTSHGREMFEEPRCSKYDFEEKILEKVVRFEIALESAQTKFDVLTEELRKQQTGLTEDRNQLLQEFQSVKDDVVSDVQKLKENVTTDVTALRTAREEDRNQLLQEFQSVTDDVVSDFQKLKENVTNDVTALQTSQERNQATSESQFKNLLHKTQDQIARISRDAQEILNKTGPVSAFTVQGSPVSAPNTHGRSGVVRFTIVVYDASGDYDVTSGVFTCRHDGVYFFALSLLRSSNTGTRYGTIYKGSEALVSASVSPSNYGNYGTSNFVTTHLVPGDNVFVGREIGATGLMSYSSFSGFLVTAG